MRHRILGLVLCCLIFAAPLMAQGPARRAARRQAVGMVRLLQQLHLTPDQRTQVRTLVQQQRQQVQALNQESLTVAQRQAKLKDIRQATRQQMLALLTPDQQQRLKDIQARRHPFQALNLTPDQQAKLKPIFQQQRQQVQAIRRDQNLTPREKQSKIRALRQDTQAQVNALLTPDQQQRLAGIQARRHPLQALNLTPDQQAKLKPLFQQQRQQVQAVRRDPDLTPRQKRAKVREIRQNAQAEVRSLLTPEQQQRLQQLRGPAPAPAPTAAPPDPNGF